MKALVIVGLAIAAPANAAPTYLSCVLHDETKDLQVNLTMDEANQVATLEIPSTGHVEHLPAVFSQTSVSFESPMSFGSFTYSISRTDLSIARTLAAPGVSPMITNGRCQVQAAPQRAF